MFLIANRVPKRLEDSLTFKHAWKQTRLCAHPSKSYVFLSRFSESDSEVADQCVATNTGLKWPVVC